MAAKWQYTNTHCATVSLNAACRQTSCPNKLRCLSNHSRSSSSDSGWCRCRSRHCGCVMWWTSRCGSSNSNIIEISVPWWRYELHGKHGVEQQTCTATSRLQPAWPHHHRLTHAAVELDVCWWCCDVCCIWYRHHRYTHTHMLRVNNHLM